MSPLTTHVLDLRLGQPAAGVAATLEKQDVLGSWHRMANGVTNNDGRIADMLAEGALAPGTYRLTFAVGEYFAVQEVEHFYPQVTIDFNVADASLHYHVPLLLSPFGYSTYRGS